MSEIKDTEITPLIDKVFDFNSISVVELLNLRLLLHDHDPMIDLERDLKELSLYPERLTGSYQYEWLTYCRRALFSKCKEQKFSSIETLNTFLIEYKYTLVRLEHVTSDTEVKITHTLRLLNTENIRLFESATSRRIREFIES